MQQLPQNRTLRKSMLQQTRKHEKTKNKLPRRNTQRRRRKRTGRDPTDNTNQPNTTGQKRQLQYKIKINGKYQHFTIDTGSPVTIMPYNPKLYNQKEIQSPKERYQDVNKNEVKFLEKM